MYRKFCDPPFLSFHPSPHPCIASNPLSSPLTCEPPIKAERAGGTHPVRGPRLLRRLVEQHVVGPVFARLEPARVRLSAAARLPLVHQRAAHLAPRRHAHHLPAERVRARTGHVVHLQERARLPAGRADGTDTTHRRQPPMAAREGCAGQCGLLGGHFHRVRLMNLPLPKQILN